MICSRFYSAVLLMGAGASLTQAATILSEGFNDTTTLAGSGWTLTNNSTPPAATGWFQGDATVFASQNGAANSYIAANFDNANFGGNISNWLITPVLTFNNGDVLSFYTRTEVSAVPGDNLQVRLSTNGASSNVGATPTSVGDFGSLLLSITSYPESWTNYNVTISGLGGPTSGRLAFRYVVTDTSQNGDYIGIDSVSVNTGAAAVPEPSTVLLSFMGLSGLLAAARARRRS